MRYTLEGMPVASFRMASSVRYRDAGGESREETILTFRQEIGQGLGRWP